MNRIFYSMGKVILTAALLAWLFAQADLSRLGAAIAGIGMPVLLGALLALSMQALLLAWRWHRIVERLGGRLPFGKAVRWIYVGLLFNQILPTAVGGDALRVWQLHRNGTAEGLAFASVAVERGTGVALMGLMILACTPVVWEQSSPALRIAFVASAAALMVGLAAMAVADRISLRWLPGALRGPVQSTAASLRRLAGEPGALLEVCALGVAALMIGFWAAYLLGTGLGIAHTLPTFIVCVGGAVLLSVLPISFGGWGVREAGMIGLFGVVGTPAESALALSILWGVLPMVVALPGAVLWWFDGGPARSLGMPAGGPR